MRGELGIFVVRDSEAGNVIDIVNSYEEGLQLIAKYESEDRDNDEYCEGFYEVASITGLQEIRQLRNLTQKQLAEKANVSLRMVQYYEQGYKSIACAEADTVWKLAKALDCSMDDLME